MVTLSTTGVRPGSPLERWARHCTNRPPGRVSPGPAARQEVHWSAAYKAVEPERTSKRTEVPGGGSGAADRRRAVTSSPGATGCSAARSRTGEVATPSGGWARTLRRTTYSPVRSLPAPSMSPFHSPLPESRLELLRPGSSASMTSRPAPEKTSSLRPGRSQRPGIVSRSQPPVSNFSRSCTWRIWCPLTVMNRGSSSVPPPPKNRTSADSTADGRSKSFFASTPAVRLSRILELRAMASAIR